ncbi:hypothetical protein IE81DRAFT_29979 [Ceraceosorus guamensis]|uniref:Alpha/beta-hydrolase n=1 Tax=Ceraceosorus guamensis TaxID=1522189 RepID=A0A316W444_9BASI|nr:hypothetical protein IE81DRAFT_29979 [Ceraceosorus guamensis]PWN44314.1 hypothetical protein IE81DRAFT_29979 [Ceraceosorus guamensis]
MRLFSRPRAVATALLVMLHHCLSGPIMHGPSNLRSSPSSSKAADIELRFGLASRLASSVGARAVRIGAGKPKSGLIAFVSEQWTDDAEPRPLVRRACNLPFIVNSFIVLHGQHRDPHRSYRAIKAAVGRRRDCLIIAPGFFTKVDPMSRAAELVWDFRPRNEADWEAKWQSGHDASTGAKRVSAFDVLDHLLRRLVLSGTYPNLERITFSGHSAGAGMLARYSYLGGAEAALGAATGRRVRIRYVLANAPSNLYFSDDRPIDWSMHAKAAKDKCKTLHTWRYQIHGDVPRYVKAGLTKDRFEEWAKMDIVRLSGDEDVHHEMDTGDQSCAAQAQGGMNRHDRNLAYWAYQNALAGTRMDLSPYLPKENLDTLQKNLESRRVDHFRHRFSIVPGVGHDCHDMFNSPLGISALFDEEFVSGPPPAVPPPGAKLVVAYDALMSTRPQPSGFFAKLMHGLGEFFKKLFGRHEHRRPASHTPDPPPLKAKRANIERERYPMPG